MQVTNTFFHLCFKLQLTSRRLQRNSEGVAVAMGHKIPMSVIEGQGPHTSRNVMGNAMNAICHFQL